MLYTWLVMCTTGGCLFDDPMIHDTMIQKLQIPKFSTAVVLVATLPIPLFPFPAISQHVASSSLQHICLKEVTRYNREKLLILFYGYVFVDLTGAKVTDVCGQAKGYIPCFRPQDKAYIITSFTYILTKTFH